MTYSTATVAGVAAFRGRDFAPGDFRRAVFGTFFIGVGSVAAMVAAMGAVIACATVAAAWIIAGLHSSSTDFRVARPFALGTAGLTRLETAALENTYRGVAGAVEASMAARALIEDTSVRSVKLLIFRKPVEQTVAAIANPAPGATAPLPAPRPLAAALIHAAHNFARPRAAATPEVTASIAPQQASLSGSSLQRFVAPQARSYSVLLASVDSRTAIYDIEAHVVYLPDGERMEAHSGLGQWIDDPSHVSMKARGATPPNVYNLVMREGLFHGVEALRLNPVGDNSMYGRDGILAHPYMLGPSGQSFGCVSFKDYEQFLQAFKRGEVDRIVVVPHLDAKPPATARANGANRFAFN